MNIEVTDLGDPDRVAARRTANDAFRAALTGGSLVLTAGIIALGAENQTRIIAALCQCAAFDDDDPFDTYNIGDVTVMLEEPGIARWRELIFFRIADNATATAPTGANNQATQHLIIMLASEW